MNISSLTPEGEFNRCPVCGKLIVIAPSKPTGDAPCPHCGVLLWFASLAEGLFFRRKSETNVESGGTPEGGGPSGTRRFDFERFHVGDHVRIKKGTFESFEGVVDAIEAESAKVQVAIEIFGHRTPVEVETWQLESA